MDWTGVPDDLKLPLLFTGTPKTVIASFGPRLTAAADRYTFRTEARKAKSRLAETTSPTEDECLATAAHNETLEDHPRPGRDCLWKTWDPVSVVLATAGSPTDDRPCHYCK